MDQPTPPHLEVGSGESGRDAAGRALSAPGQDLARGEAREPSGKARRDVQRGEPGRALPQLRCLQGERAVGGEAAEHASGEQELKGMSVRPAKDEGLRQHPHQEGTEHVDQRRGQREVEAR